MPPETTTWYRVRAAADDSAAEIEIFADIGANWFGDGITATSFKSDWDQIKNRPQIKVLINSFGGSVFEALAIYNIINQARERVSVEVLGVAASAASVVALAGKDLLMREGSFFMIHKPLAGVVGNADDMREVAETLDKIEGQILGIYGNRSALLREEIAAAMRKETWYTAEEALEAGFADSITKTERKAAPEPSDSARRYLNRIPTALVTPPAREELAAVHINTPAIAASARARGEWDTWRDFIGGESA